MSFAEPHVSNCWCVSNVSSPTDYLIIRQRWCLDVLDGCVRLHSTEARYEEISAGTVFSLTDGS